MPELRQILLIPQDRYWDWVQAVRDYAVHFSVTMTPDPDSAGRFCAEGHTVSVINFPGAWPDDMVAWFRQHYPAVVLDVLKVSTPEALEELLGGRVADEDRFGQGPVLRLVWPTNYNVVTQAFGANPQYYRRFGLPGHEGVDIRALPNTPIYACAPGQVYMVYNSTHHAYGIHVRVRHAGGYKTIYAHLIRSLVNKGEQVTAGQKIGQADSTGNSSASHLHLTLKKEGATERGETRYPYDIIDPTPFWQMPRELDAPPAWRAGKGLIGVHGRADGPLLEPDYAAIETARVEAVKLMVNAQPSDVDRCRQINPNCFVLARLFADFRNGRVVEPEAFAEWQKHDMERLYAQGVRYFEVHNEPNLNLEGFGSNWQNGDGFEAWFLRVVGILRPLFPDAKFGFPGCSPGGDLLGKRQDMWRFVEQCESAMAAADWIGVHCYWLDEAEMLAPEHGFGFVEYQRRWPDKLVFVTEFSNPSPEVDMHTKGRQYVEYFRHLRRRPGIGAAFSFVLSASTDFPHEVWRREDGRATAIPFAVGDRDFS